MILFKYLKLAWKTAVPSGIYSSFKIGLIADTKSQVNNFLKDYSSQSKNDGTSDVLEWIKDISHIWTAKINFIPESREWKAQSNQLFIKFNKLESKYSYKIDKILCQNAYEKGKCTPQVKKIKNCIKMTNSIKQRFLTRIQSRDSTPINNMHQYTPQHLFEFRKAIQDKVKPFVLNKETLSPSKGLASKRTQKNLRNIFKWRLSTLTTADWLQSTKNSKQRSSSVISIPKQEPVSIKNTRLFRNYDSLALKNGKEDLIRQYFNYKPHFK